MGPAVWLGTLHGITVKQGKELLELLRSRIAPTNRSVDKFVGIFSVR